MKSDFRVILSTVLMLVALPGGAAAQVRSFDIPAQPARTGIPEFARQAEVQILVANSDVAEQQVAAVSGDVDVRQALRQLLTGTDLSIVSDDGRTITLAAPKPSVPEPAASPDPPEAATSLDEIIVVGSQIKGAVPTGALPVTVMDDDDIRTTAATSGDELFRSIPQAGDVAFNESRTVGGINDARGDTASINLRALGTGNTLVLLNGRRMVLHPGTQAENLVPVTTVNTNSLPVMAIRRVEVLRDGASAIYGTDAVGGVINTILKSNFEGLTTEVQYGGSDGTNLRELDASFELGIRPNGGRTSLSIFGSYNDRDPLFASERRYTRSADNRPLVVGTPFEGDSDFNNTSTSTPWGVFDRLTTGNISQNGTVLSNAAGQLHIQPDTLDGCRGTFGNGLCFDDGTSLDSEIRYNINDERTLTGGYKRGNLFGFLEHDLTDETQLFAELGVYYADYDSQREQAALLSSTRIAIPASNYWNPFGPTTLNGAPNPSRLDGLNVPAEGIALELRQYRPIDVGPRFINVQNTTTRYLMGLRGKLGPLDWESAGLYSKAKSDDTTSNRISNTLFQQALALSTPQAYNPFNGGDLADPANGDATPNDAATINSFLIDVSRVSETSLAQWDFKVSTPRILPLPAGGLGLAAGVELRRETYRDDRDPRLDGTITFTDTVTGLTSGSDVMGSSPTPDTAGDRDVGSAFVELAVPLVSPAMKIPLVRSLDMQLAARYENYTFFGGVTKPKAALSWYPAEWVQIRSSISEGFRAPNLPQVFEVGVERVNTRTDYIRCEADVRAGVIDNFDDCGRTQAVTSLRSGSRDLEPEDSENFSAGVVFLPTFLPPRAGRVTATADYWRVDQEKVVGIFGDTNAIALDYLLRVRGSSNPNVVRADPTQADIDAFAGTGLQPVGDILSVNDNYVNLLPRTVEGIDFGLFYDLDDTPWGNFNVKLNAAKLLTFFQDPSADAAAILAAQSAGEISPGFTVQGANELVRQDGRPRWRGTASLTWRKGDFGAGWLSTYVGSVLDNDATTADGTVWRVEDWLTHNLYVQYSFRKLAFGDTEVRLGARNITNEEPPLAATDFAYAGELHSALGRFWYASLRVKL